MGAHAGEGGAAAGELSPAAERLHRWLVALIASKREEIRTDPDLFAAYAELSSQSREVIKRHVEILVGQMARIIAEGAAAGQFAADDPARVAKSVFDATVRFHHPAHSAQWFKPGIDEAFDGVWALVLSGLSPR